jgi:uncharacterized integral membrane protein
VGLGYLVVALVAAAIAVFALQNGEPTRVRFLVWGLEGVPMAALILISLAAGAVVVGLPLGFRVWRLRSEVRTLRGRVSALESLQAPRPERPGPPASRG